MTIDRYLSVREAAQALNFTVKQLRGLVERGAIPYARVGRRILFRESVLVAWQRARDVSPVPPARPPAADIDAAWRDEPGATRYLT